MMIKVLITDGTYKNSLATLRSLGRKNYWVDVTTSYPRYFSLCSYSKYHKKIFRITSSLDDTDSYAEELIKIIEKEKHNVFIPVGLKSYLAVARYKKDFESLTGVLVPDWKEMIIASNKDKTMNFAKKIGIPTPATHIIDDEKEIDEITKFPVVIKSSDEASKSIRYCNNKTELITRYQELKKTAKTKIIAQEYIKGFGCGFYGVYKNGKLIAHFLHKRIKEFPITGGPSAVAEAYYDEKLYMYGKKLCDSLRWNGPIMAEFKYDAEENDYKLIEVNPKLWGSLDLTIQAGVDIPKILVDLILNGKTDYKGYNYIKFRWVFPDEFKVLVSDFSIENLKKFIQRDKDTKTNITLEDFGPVIIQVFIGMIESLEILVNKNKMYPHGRVKT